MSYQHHIISGNVGRVQELKYTQTGVAFLNFSVAVNNRYKNQAGATVDETTWYQCTAWRGLAEMLFKNNLSAGQKVVCAGRKLEAKLWTNNQGQPQVQLQLTVDDFDWGGSKSENNAPSSGGSEDDDWGTPPPQDMNDIPF